MQVKDAAASIDPWIQIPDLSENLGHIALAEGRMKDALQLYNHVQRRWHRGTSAELLQLSARALYDEDSRHYTGGETDKVSLLPEARVQLMKAVHLDPSNPQMRFNGATVMQVLPSPTSYFIATVQEALVQKHVCWKLDCKQQISPE